MIRQHKGKYRPEFIDSILKTFNVSAETVKLVKEYLCEGASISSLGTSNQNAYNKIFRIVNDIIAKSEPLEKGAALERILTGDTLVNAKGEKISIDTIILKRSGDITTSLITTHEVSLKEIIEEEVDRVVKEHNNFLKEYSG